MNLNIFKHLLFSNCASNNQNVINLILQVLQMFNLLFVGIIIMNYNTEILSLWIGPQSQQAAHHFYSLQAQQFFEDNQDPTNHQSLWTINNKTNEKVPKMMIFDTKSDNLTRIRKVNHAKILKKMSQKSNQQDYFSFFAQEQKEQIVKQTEEDTSLFENWTAKEENYVLINKKLNEEAKGFDFWEGLYKLEQQNYEDRIRKRLESLDYLHILSFCSDGERLGFTNQLFTHLQDQCPKKTLVFANLSKSRQEQYTTQVCLPLLSEISPQVNILVDIDTSQLNYTYFEGNFYHHFAPLFNCLMTPFILKDNSSSDYINQVSSGKRTLFDLGFTLPIISEKNELNKATNIFDYLPNKKENSEDTQINRINFANRSFLDLYQYTTSGKELLTQRQKHTKNGKPQKISYRSQRVLSQSYVLKGHFNQIAKLCHQRSQLFDIKYLQGIFEANPENKLNYSEFYRKQYGEKVQVFPMHSVLYQHSAFGPSIRNYIRFSNLKGANELHNEWKEGAINLSDLYVQQTSNDSD